MKLRRENLKDELEKYRTWVPPGHYYSPIPNKAEIVTRKEEIYIGKENFSDIDLNLEHQYDLLDSFQTFYGDLPFALQKTDELRYYYENSFFSYGDGITLYSMIRRFNPRRIIEVGSGFSSAVMMDVNDLFQNGQIDLTFIEPYANRLKGLLTASDNVRIIEDPVQSVDPELFKVLEENDILFIDSTHVAKVGSDVNHLFFEVLPLLQRGVLVHIHDISNDFELPFMWVMEGRAWNESYLLKTFLMNNSAYKIEMFNAYVGTYYQEWLQQYMPKFLENPGGSFWMRKTK